MNRRLHDRPASRNSSAAAQHCRQAEARGHGEFSEKGEAPRGSAGRFHTYSEALRRFLDISAVSLGLIVAFPLMAIITILIKSTSRGPVIFRQDRVGRNEEIFQIYKFRTMVHRAGDIGGSITTSADCRITPIGKILRITKLDELPQLINILKGEMSLVGPRPDVPEIVQNYTPEMKRVFQVRPGITSIATLHLMDEETILAKIPDVATFYKETLVPFKVRLAMEHVDRLSIAFDMKILCMTVWMLLLGNRRRLDRPVPR